MSTKQHFARQQDFFPTLANNCRASDQSSTDTRIPDNETDTLNLASNERIHLQRLLHFDDELEGGEEVEPGGEEVQ